MLLSKEKIIEAVGEVMSQRQFQFKEPFHWPDLSFFHFLGDIFPVLIIIAIIVFAFLYLKDLFKQSEQRNQPKSINVDQAKNQQPFSGSPIEQLHGEFLNVLQNRQIVTLQAWKTNTDYVKESENLLFQKVCVLYDVAIYGAKEISNASVSLLNEEFKTWEKKKP